MATKAQAKAAVDSVSTQIKADIDNILPAGVNLKDGSVSFGPARWTLLLDAGGSLNTAVSWRDTIKTNLDAAGRSSSIYNGIGRRAGEGNSDRSIQIFTSLCVYSISNF